MGNSFGFVAPWFLSQPLSHDIEEQLQTVHEQVSLAGLGLLKVILKPMLADGIITAISLVQSIFGSKDDIVLGLVSITFPTQQATLCVFTLISLGHDSFLQLLTSPTHLDLVCLHRSGQLRASGEQKINRFCAISHKPGVRTLWPYGCFFSRNTARSWGDETIAFKEHLVYCVS